MADPKRDKMIEKLSKDHDWKELAKLDDDELKRMYDRWMSAHEGEVSPLRLREILLWGMREEDVEHLAESRAIDASGGKPEIIKRLLRIKDDSSL
jgi:hypothetical protein